MSLIVDKWVTVGEWQSDVDTNILLRNGDWIDISAQGKIWAGVWFTGENTATGWPGWTAGNDKPLPGSPPFCLLGRTTEDGYFYVGDGIRRTYQNASLGPGETRFSLRINDNTPGNGSGAFNVHIMVWRNPDAVIALTPAGSDQEETLFRGGAGRLPVAGAGRLPPRSWRRKLASWSEENAGCRIARGGQGADCFGMGPSLPPRCEGR